ncbi:hypothetical protein K7X08_005914 [Anisodus acutangulus]|uniref:Uncharacterized protein n=1 Tax=Anisodus acutangulus TaxID=402998 RepID=A0A9Q1LS71_9SOLA|nr:hypothetical protein K7X08_005914 [Anisodus acutangulus]
MCSRIGQEVLTSLFHSVDHFSGRRMGSGIAQESLSHSAGSRMALLNRSGCFGIYSIAKNQYSKVKSTRSRVVES